MAPSVLRIAYRDFWDVPRLVIVFRGSERLLLDCPFDESLDDYPSDYTVYRLPDDFTPPEGSWTEMVGQATERLGTVAVEDVRFDASHRIEIDATSLQRFLSPQGGSHV